MAPWFSETTGMRACVNMALVAMSVIIGILFCEVSFRIVGYTNPVDVKPPRKGMAPRFYYVADPVNGHDLAKNFAGGIFFLPDYIRTYGAPFPLSSNGLGCRDRSFEPGDGYVLLLGDSFTWGYVALEQTLGVTVEHLIGMRVLNCGVAGYGPRQEAHKLKTVVAFAGKPRLVIVSYVMNDLLDDYLFSRRTVIDGYMVNKMILTDTTRGSREIRSDEVLRGRLESILNPDIGIRGQAKDLLGHYSITYDLLLNGEALRPVVSRLGLTKPATLSDLEAYKSIVEFPWLEQAWDEHLENLRALKREVEALGATLLVVIFPDAVQVYDSLRPQQGNLQWEYPNQRLSEFFHQEQIEFVDLLPEFRRDGRCSGGSPSYTSADLYWTHDAHPNVRGNRLAGLLIGRHVLERPFLEVDDKSDRLSKINQLLSAEDRCGSTASLR